MLKKTQFCVYLFVKIQKSPTEKGEKEQQQNLKTQTQPIWDKSMMI